MTDIVESEVESLRLTVERLKAKIADLELGIEPCLMCEALQHKAEAERDEAKARLDSIVDSLLAYGWVVADPWDAKWADTNCMEIVDAGPMCPVCGQCAPKEEKWPQGATMYATENHAIDCALATVLRARIL